MTGKALQIYILVDFVLSLRPVFKIAHIYQQMWLMALNCKMMFDTDIQPVLKTYPPHLDTQVST